MEKEDQEGLKVLAEALKLAIEMLGANAQVTHYWRDEADRRLAELNELRREKNETAQQLAKKQTQYLTIARQQEVLEKIYEIFSRIASGKARITETEFEIFLALREAPGAMGVVIMAWVEDTESGRYIPSVAKRWAEYVKK